jgi:ubiquinone/menaquinone biosynthesis C-methylase UbiE
MTKVQGQNLTPTTTGLVLHGTARFYDLIVWVVMLGRERVFREKVIDLARLKTGESVLDVGCGTGTLAIAAKRRVGPTGIVNGIDASPEMIARADRKAKKAKVEVVFKTAVVETLPFPDAHFDVVLSTLMLHHLPRPAREQCALEMRRVLKPGGRVLAVDFSIPQGKRSLLAHFHPRHGHVELRDMIALLNQAGLNVVESGAVGIRDLQFALAETPSGT